MSGHAAEREPQTSSSSSSIASRTATAPRTPPKRASYGPARVIASILRDEPGSLIRVQQVRPKESARESRVACLDRVEQRLVLGEDRPQVLGRPRLAEPHDADEAAQLREDPLDERQRRSGRDVEVELLVEVDELVLVPGVDGPLLLQQQEPEVVDLLQLHPLACTGHRQRLDGQADVHDLTAMLGREAAHDHLPPRPDLEQPFLAQRLQRLADGRLRDLERVRDRAFRNGLADGEPAAQDLVAHVLVGTLREAVVAARRHLLRHAASLLRTIAACGSVSSERRTSPARSSSRPSSAPKGSSSSRSRASPSARGSSSTRRGSRPSGPARTRSSWRRTTWRRSTSRCRTTCTPNGRSVARTPASTFCVRSRPRARETRRRTRSSTASTAA